MARMLSSCPVLLDANRRVVRAPFVCLLCRDDLPKAGLANITATMFSLLGLQAPSHYEPSLI